MDPNALVEMGGQGALVAVVLAAFKVFEGRAAKKSGGAVDARIEILALKMEQCEDALGQVTTEIKNFRSDFVEFREEVRLTWERERMKEEFNKERASGTH